MITGAWMLLLLSMTVSVVRAEDALLGHAALQLSTTDLLRALATEPPARPRAVEELPARFLSRLTEGRIGVGPLLTLVPPERRELVESEPPMFAFMVRAKGRRFVTFTRPGARIDQDDRLMFQRLLVSELFEGRRYSLTVYEDHAVSRRAARFLGAGARLVLRPAVEPLGYMVRLELLSSFHPDHGATGYLALSARLPAPGPPASLPLPVP